MDVQFEISGAEVKNGEVEVICICHPDDEIPGGELFINAGRYELYDESYTGMTIEELRGVSAAYWSRFRRKEL
ncbi:MAG: hypothetical protein M3R17_03275 [Bacteroidota bacterium]|nr:hypothetical protein [Bacteroidota bacterium]